MAMIHQLQLKTNDTNHTTVRMEMVSLDTLTQ